MLQLSCKIEIEGSKKWIFEHTASCKIDRDSDSLISTCEIILPRKVKWANENCCPLNNGDRIKVYLGYDGKNELAFDGYIVSIGMKTPVKLYCEDEMLKLKGSKMDYSVLNGGISNNDLLKLFTDKKVRCIDFELNEFFRTSCENVAAFLNYVMSFGPDKYFFRYLDGENTLVCLNIFTPNLAQVTNTFVYDDSINLIDISDLEVFSPMDNNVYVCINVMASVNHKRLRIERGVKDRATKRFIYHKFLSDEDIANRLADYIIERESKTRLTGSFRTFGGKLAWPFDIAAIKIQGERMGKYIIRKNVITFGKNGFRQKITLGELVDE